MKLFRSSAHRPNSGHNHFAQAGGFSFCIMIVMPANASGSFFQTLAYKTGRLGHLYSPRAQRGPWPWFPYALDNGAFSCWEPVNNTFDMEKWNKTKPEWFRLLFWAQAAHLKPRWAIVPDIPGNGARTLAQWESYVVHVKDAGFKAALAVQDGMNVDQILALHTQPDVIFVGGTTEWKWKTAEMWCKCFPRVHVGRVNSPDKLYWLDSIGCESCDGTGWNRGDRKQTQGLETWCRSCELPTYHNQPLWPYTCRQKKDKDQDTFA